MKKIILVLIISLVLTGCFTVPDPEPKGFARIVLVGAGNYPGCSNDLSAPPYAIDGMEELFNRCYDIETLTVLKDYKATKKNILDEIYYTFENATENDVSIFYFAGHGGVKYGVYRFYPTDTDWTTTTSVTIPELEYLLDRVAGTKIVILDCCHSGGFIQKEVYRFLNRPGYQVLTSCMGEQVCYQMGGSSFIDPYMVFTRGILEGCKQNYLADIDNDGTITMAEVYNFAVDWVENNFSKEQDAQMYPDDSTFPFVGY